MAFPTNIDTFTDPTSSNYLDDVAVPHATIESNQHHAISAIETYVGVSGSTDATSLTYKQSNTTGGHNHDGSNSRAVAHSALTGLTTGDPHTQYLLKSLHATKGQILGTNATPAPVALNVGSDGQVLTADSTQTLGIKWATGGGGAGDFVTNTSYLSTVPIGNGTSSMVAANDAVFIPQWVPKTMTIATMRVRFTGAATGNFQLGFYSAGFNQLAHLGTTACPSAGWYDWTVPGGQSLTGGTFVYIGFWIDNLTQSIARFTGAGYTSLPNYTVTSGLTGGLPATMTPDATPGTSTGGGRAPFVYLLMT